MKTPWMQYFSSLLTFTRQDGTLMSFIVIPTMLLLRLRKNPSSQNPVHKMMMTSPLVHLKLKGLRRNRIPVQWMETGNLGVCEDPLLICGHS